MTLAPIIAAPPVIQLHVAAALLAFALGTAQLVRPKGTASHRVRGYVWVAIMLVIAISSFWIAELRTWGPFSPIHLLSIWVLAITPYGVLAARRGRIGAHRRTMLGLFFGALVIAGLFTLLPGRIMHSVVFGG